MKLFFVATGLLLVACLHGSHAFWGKKRFPNWNKLSVTFLKFSGLPMTEDDAKSDGWKMVNDCLESKHFVGKRYILNGDSAVVLLFDANGQVAGIQTGVPPTMEISEQYQRPLFAEDGGLLYLTAYFVDPRKICTKMSRDKGYLGDQLLLQAGPYPNKTISMPLRESGIAGTKWRKGKCFYAMGQHYWYDISANMNCEKFFPMFLMYNSGKLNGFGWAMGGFAKSKRYEHPTWDKLDYFFQKSTKPLCLKEKKDLTTQHIYLDRFPYFNFC